MPNPRTTAAAKLLSGTFRGDRMKNIDPTKAPSRRPAPPSTLSEGGKEEWKRLAPKAWDQGTLQAADCRAFELLCETLATEREARAMIERDGLTIEAINGGQKANPALKILESARAQATRLLVEFGLTPKSRTGVDMSPPEKPEDNPYANLDR